MNGVDYTKQSRRERESFHDAIKKNNEANEKRLADTNVRNEKAQEKQKNTFIEDKADIEKSVSKNMERIKNETKSALATTQLESQEKLREERDAFTKDTHSTRKKFDDRLNDIKSSYQKSFETENDHHKEVQDVQKQRYDQNLNSTRNNSDGLVKKTQDKLTGTGSELKDQFNKEKFQQVRAHEESLKNVHKDAAIKRNDLKLRINDDITNTREASAADAAQAKQYAGDRLTANKNKYAERFEAVGKDYSQRTNDQVEAQQLEAKKTNRAFQQKFTDANREHDKNLNAVELESRRRNNGSGDFADVMEGQQGLKEKVVADNKIKNLKGKLVEAQSNYLDRAAQDQASFNYTFKKENADASARLERKSNEVNADKIMTVAKAKEKAEVIIQNREHQNKTEKESYEQQLMLERNNANTRIKKLKESFNHSMTALEEQQKINVEDVTKSSNQDKAEFVKMLNEKRNNEVFAMKREFNKMLDGTVNDYEQRIAMNQRDYEYLKLNMEQKISNIIDQSDKKTESQRKVFDERHTANLKGYQLLMDQRESELKKQINQTHIDFQRKLDKFQVSSETKLKLLTNDYENKLMELRTSTSKDLAVKDFDHQVEQERVKQAFEGEKVRLISSYETQIDSHKARARDQVERMKEFKKLS